MGSFNIRVYGLLIDNEKGLLVSDEWVRGNLITKLPGGGLEFGEGTKDCLAREFMEETGCSVSVGEHFYTTDFFQISAFNPEDQIISIYYFVQLHEDFHLSTNSHPMAGEEVFRWIPLRELSKSCMTLPIDQLAIEKLLNNYC